MEQIKFVFICLNFYMFKHLFSIEEIMLFSSSSLDVL